MPFTLKTLSSMSQSEFESLFSEKGHIEVQNMDSISDESKFEAICSIIQKMILFGSKDVSIQDQAKKIIEEAKIKPHDTWGEVLALHKWVQSNIRYINDPLALETFQNARVTLEKRSGDCDCMSILLSSMLRGVGRNSGVMLVNSGGGEDVDHAIPVISFNKDIVLMWGVKNNSGEVEYVSNELAESLPKEVRIPLKILKFSGKETKWVPLEVTVNKPAGWWPDKMTYAVVITPELVTEKINVKRN